MAKKKKTFIVGNPDQLCEEFFKNYPLDYWLYKILFLKNAHDSFETLKSGLTKNMEGVVDDDCKRVLRTEMHFLYFQLVEALFEMIFAICAHDPRYLWATLSFSDWRQTYDKIKLVSEGRLKEPDFKNNIQIGAGDKKMEISTLRWIFYFGYPISLTDEQWGKNLNNIERMLRVFAEDFSDRGDYNAYKHSLRFYHSSFSFALGRTGASEARVMGSSPDCINFLEEEVEADAAGQKQIFINTTMKPFDFDRDYRCSIAISNLIQNIINTRKYSLLKEFVGKPFEIHKFDGIKLPEFTFARTGVSRFSVRA